MHRSNAYAPETDAIRLNPGRDFCCFNALAPLIPPTPFSHKGRRGSLGVLMPETEDGTQGLAKKSTPVSNPLLPQGEKGEFGRPDA
jgi:hypothetical protein